MYQVLKKLYLHNQFVAGILVLGFGWLIFEIREVLVAIFISYIIMAALAPLVARIKLYKIPNGVAVAIAYVMTLVLLFILIFPLISLFIDQVQLLFTNFAVYLNRAAEVVGIRVSASQVQSFLTSESSAIGRNAFSVTQKVFGGVFSSITIFVVSFYLLLDHDNIKHRIASLFPVEKKEGILEVTTQIEEKLGAWIRGQIVLSLFIGVLTYLALLILGIEFALPLAVLAGILEIVPTLGPVIAAIPAIIVALTISPTQALIVAIAYFGIQLLENNLLVPRIMQKAVGLNPVVIIIGIIIGGKLLGVPGALLSIPFMSLCQVIFSRIKTLA